MEDKMMCSLDRAIALYREDIKEDIKKEEEKKEE